MVALCYHANAATFSVLPSLVDPGSCSQGHLLDHVYRPIHDGRNLYVKFQLDRKNEAVVISFKSDESR